MTKKRLFLIAIVPLIIVVMIGSLISMSQPRPVVTKDAFKRIQDKMTIAEVEAILGPTEHMAQRARGRAMVWENDDGSRGIIFFTDDHVSYKQWIDSNETAINKLCRSLHLR